MAWPALGVLFLASAAALLVGLFAWALSGLGGQPHPHALWEGLIFLGLGLAALLVFLLALWLYTRTRAALAVLLTAAALSVVLLGVGIWDTATCAPRECDPTTSFYPSTPFFRWIENPPGRGT